MKKLLLITLTTVALFSKSITATKACEAFNDLKHNKNYGHIVLEPNSNYEVAREQNGNYYIKVPNANPTMRWVSVSCFNGSNSAASSATQNSSSKESSNLDSVLVVSWHNSFCETHSNKRECKRDGGEYKNHLVLHGLWPQPRNNIYCGVDERIIALDKSKRWNALPKLNLKPEVIELMQKYMPGYKSNLQRHEYYKHGSCYSKDANRYYLDALQLTKRVDETIGEYLRVNIGKRVKTINIKKIAERLIAKDIKNKIAVKCKRGLLSEIWISIKGKGKSLKDLIKGAKPIHSNCQEAIVDAPGKFRRF